MVADVGIIVYFVNHPWVPFLTKMRQYSKYSLAGSHVSSCLLHAVVGMNIESYLRTAMAC